MSDIVDRAGRSATAAIEVCAKNSLQRAHALISQVIRREAVAKVSAMRHLVLQRALDTAQRRVRLLNLLKKAHSNLSSPMSSSSFFGGSTTGSNSNEDESAVGLLVRYASSSSTSSATNEEHQALTAAHFVLRDWIRQADASCVLELAGHPWNPSLQHERMILFSRTLDGEDDPDHDDSSAWRRQLEEEEAAAARFSPNQRLTDDVYVDSCITPYLTHELLKSALSAIPADRGGVAVPSVGEAAMPSPAAGSDPALLLEYIAVVSDRLALRMAMDELRQDPKVCVVRGGPKKKLVTAGTSGGGGAVVSCPPLTLITTPDSLPMCVSLVYHAVLLRCCASNGLHRTLGELESLCGCSDTAEVVHDCTSDDDDDEASEVVLVAVKKRPVVSAASVAPFQTLNSEEDQIDRGIVHYLVDVALDKMISALSNAAGGNSAERAAALRRLQQAVKRLQ